MSMDGVGTREGRATPAGGVASVAGEAWAPILLGVVNLSPEKERVFAELVRVLRPGGRISVSDMVVEDLPDWARETAASYAACVGGAVSEQEYVAGLEHAGLVDVAVSDRLVYTGDQLCSFGEGGDARLGELDGMVQSLRFTGRKPR